MPRNTTVSPISFRRIAAIWLIAATFALVQSATQFAHLSSQRRTWALVGLTFIGWLAWAAFTPPIIYLTRRFPIQRGNLVKAFSVHLPVAFVFQALVYVVWEILIRLLANSSLIGTVSLSDRAYSFWSQVLNPVGNAMVGFVTYACIVAAVTAFDAVERSHQSALAAARLERDVAQAREQAIKMQVHPHFLFNTLHAVSVLIAEDPPTARAMVMHLGDFLRATLERATRAEVTLREELELLTHYFDVERLRFGERLTVSIIAHEDLLEAYVPDLVLQPLAENAIKHGVSSRPGTHAIVIGAARRDSQLVLTVDDEGARPMRLDSREGIGLRSTRRRLAHLYGDAGELTLSARPMGGMRASVVLPFHLTPMNAGDTESADDEAAERDDDDRA